MASKVKDGRRWQLDTRSVNSGLAHIFATKEFSDLGFIVGSNKKEFKAHRIFVAARCPQLLNIKEGDDLPSVSKIYLPDVSEEAFEILHNYIFTSVINKMDCQDLVLDVYLVATTYGLTKLQEECQKFISEWDINCDNVIAMLQMTDVKFVQDRCWEFLQTHARRVLQSKSITTALSETLVRIFEKGYFSGIPTMELLSRIVEWSAKHYKLEKNKENEKKSYKRVRNELLIPHGETSKCLMSWIGFQNLDSRELSQVVSEYPELLTAEEFTKFVTYGYAVGKKPSLPEWV